MHTTTIISALEECRATIYAEWVEPPAARQFSDEDMLHLCGSIPPRKVAAHLLYMIDESKLLVGRGEQQKAQRWLCFIQGVLWATDSVSISKLRQDNKG